MGGSFGETSQADPVRRKEHTIYEFKLANFCVSESLHDFLTIQTQKLENSFSYTTGYTGYTSLSYVAMLTRQLHPFLLMIRPSWLSVQGKKVHKGRFFTSHVMEGYFETKKG